MTDRASRRRFQFSLRTLMIGTAVLAAASGWLGSKIEQKRRQRAAAEVIVKNGGQVSYDYERIKGEPGYWHNVFSEVDCIYCISATENLKEFPHLLSLRLMSWGITDERLESVKSLKELRYLALIETKVSDAGVNELHLALPKCYIIVLTDGFSRKDYPPIEAGASN
jgi:hypothetical protein